MDIFKINTKRGDGKCTKQNFLLRNLKKKSGNRFVRHPLENVSKIKKKQGKMDRYGNSENREYWKIQKKNY